MNDFAESLSSGRKFAFSILWGKGKGQVGDKYQEV